MRFNLYILFLILLFFCTTSTQAQSSELTEDKIIEEQLSGRKLDVIEGIWIKNGQYFDAIYKRGKHFIRFNLDTSVFVGAIYKRNEFEYYGECKLTINTGLKGIFAETISGEFELISLDDNNLSSKCTRENYISQGAKTLNPLGNIGKSIFQKKSKPQPQDYETKLIFSRYWPKDLKEHNSQY